MDKKSSSTLRKWSALAAVPAIAMLFMAFARPHYPSSETTRKGTSISESRAVFGASALAQAGSDSAAVKKPGAKGQKPDSSLKSVILRVDPALSGEERPKPLILLDNTEISYEMLETIDQNEIESITVFKDASAKATYGEKGSNGVIMINTKQEHKPFWRILNAKMSPKATSDLQNMIFIIDGKKVSCKEVGMIEEDDIESITILKDSSAVKVYGEEAKRGVIVIEMKNKKADEKAGDGK